MPYDSHTKSSSGEKCRAESTTVNNSISRSPVSEEESRQIYNRLSAAHTKSSSCTPCKSDPPVAKNILSPTRDEESTKQIFERLSSEQTKSSRGEQCRATGEEVTPSRQVPEADVDQIVERLHNTHTKSYRAAPCRSSPAKAQDTISRPRGSDDDVDQITQRLVKTHTKSSSGGAECKTMDPLKSPGYGQKMYPIIDGLVQRFSGRLRPATGSVDGITQRLTSAQTKASQARLDNPRILLYPERTLLCNNVARIGMFQQNGVTVRQKELARREKWYI